MRKPNPKWVKVFPARNGTAFAIDTNGNLWEMENGSDTVGYKVAVMAGEVPSILRDMARYKKRWAFQKQIDDLERQIGELKKNRDVDVTRYLSPTSEGYDVRHWQDGSLSIGCVTLKPDELAPVLRVLSKSVKKL